MLELCNAEISVTELAGSKPAKARAARQIRRENARKAVDD
jgi:hypothetical protein